MNGKEFMEATESEIRRNWEKSRNTMGTFSVSSLDSFSVSSSVFLYSMFTGSDPLVFLSFGLTIGTVTKTEYRFAVVYIYIHQIQVSVFTPFDILSLQLLFVT